MVTGRPDFGNPIVYDQTLTKPQRNQLFAAVRSLGLDPKQFSWEEVNSSDHQRPDVKVSKLIHLSGGFFLFNSTRDGSLFYTRSPGVNSRVESRETPGWIHQLAAAQQWLGLLRQELEEPDLWATLQEEKSLSVAAAAETENTRFSSNEISRIHQDVAEIREFILSANRLSAEHAQFVTAQLSYLTEAADRLGRKDFLNITVSVLLNIVFAVAMNSQSTGDLMRFAARIFHWLLQNQMLLP